MNIDKFQCKYYNDEKKCCWFYMKRKGLMLGDIGCIYGGLISWSEHLLYGSCYSMEREFDPNNPIDVIHRALLRTIEEDLQRLEEMKSKKSINIITESVNLIKSVYNKWIK